jgi:uncharacterized protein
MATELTCPKCQSAMRNYERNDIRIDQCTGCRGVFLDRGELEQLLDAEAAYSQAPRPGAPRPPAAPTAQPQGYGWSQDDRRERPAYGGGHHDKRRKGFLSEFFD